ncbi:MAG: GNAT family N-acetyltransferase [Prevotella sp.]|nr:GNAT family N-acetyltransferase [Prevotella sp.]MBQ6208420.1 GNAT family N-acetyltransferase [Prevotella sp.]
MTIDQLLVECDIIPATKEKLSQSKTFSCDDDDLDEFFAKDCLLNQQKLLGKTYFFCLRSRPDTIVSAFSLSNDSIRLTNRITDEYKEQFLDDTELHDKTMKRFPAVLIGRLGTNKEFAGKGYGSAMMDFIKVLFRTNNRTGCRFLIVDALNRPDTLHYYEKNDFRYLIEDERLEAKYMGIGVGRLPLNTRLMYFDLLKLKVE